MSEYWIEKYRQGHRQSYPWDSVVTFVMRHAPRDRPRADVRILEVGCGTGSNLWFAAREGFSVAGLDISEDAIRDLATRLGAEGLSGDFRAGSFTKLPFESGTFDLAIDRAALTCATIDDIELAVRELGRVLRPGGLLFLNSYAEGHTSAYSQGGTGSGTIVAPDIGSLAGLDRITFLTRSDLDRLFANGWAMRSLQRVEQTELLQSRPECHAEWRLVAERLGE